MFGAVVCKLQYSIVGNFPVRTVKIGPLKNFPLYGIQIRARKCYIESLSLVLKDKEAASLKMKGLLYSCLLIVRLPSGSRTLN